MSITTYPFGRLSDGTIVTAARLENRAGASVTVLDYGATVAALRVPARGGELIDVVLGYDTASEYEQNGGCLGATIGRVANRIAGASFTLNGRVFTLAKNNGENHIHGGIRGFHRLMWQMTAGDEDIVCQRLSPDGEEGYPGNLDVRVTFRLTEDNALHILYDALSDADTPVNLTNHSYFNLDGGGTILDHLLTVNADQICQNGPGCLPTGRLLEVAGTPFDFREEHPVGERIGEDDEQLLLAGGYDHNYCLAGTDAATLRSARSGLEMTVTTDRPGMQLYSGNSLTTRPGRPHGTLGPRTGLCLETQIHPNALACPNFPSPILPAGVPLHSETVYAFRSVSP